MKNFHRGDTWTLKACTDADVSAIRIGEKMATKLDMNYVKNVRESHRNAHNGFESLVCEVQRLEGQVGAYERACVAILETIDSHGRLWGCNRGTENPSIEPEDAILKAVRGLIDVAARNVEPINEDDSHA
jgi:hypothetical protein